jgi:hypothetical protein
MGLGMDKPWIPLTGTNAKSVAATTGVYQLGNESGDVIDIDYAGGRTPFGLRGVLLDRIASAAPGTHFRVEIHSQYMSRYRELLMLHYIEAGDLPAAVRGRGVRAPWRTKRNAQNQKPGHPTGDQWTSR